MGVPAVFARISRCSLQWGVFTAAASVLLGAPDGQGGRHVLVEGDLTVTIETAAAEPLPRFDQTAVVRSVTCHGREWLEGPGLADEFGLEGFGVLGFTDASLGGNFVKIGVGVLTRDVPGPYRFRHPYPCRANFPTEVTAGAKELRVVQASSEVNGYRYVYTKTYAVGADRTLTILYQLHNDGQRPFSFEHYNHNFFRLPERDGAVGTRLEAGFDLAAPPGGWQHVSARAVRWAGERFLTTGQFWRQPLAPAAEAHEVTMTWPDGAGVRIEGTSPVHRFAVWLERSAVCPELFSRFSVQPGETARWSRRYQFAVASDQDGGRS